MSCPGTLVLTVYGRWCIVVVCTQSYETESTCMLFLVDTQPKTRELHAAVWHAQPKSQQARSSAWTPCHIANPPPA